VNKLSVVYLYGFLVFLTMQTGLLFASGEDEYLAFVKREIPLTDLIEFPEGEGNAADIYWKVLMKYHNPKLDNVLVRGYRESADPYSITWNSEDIQTIEKGTKQRICIFAPTYWPYAIQFNDPVPSWIVLDAIVTALMKKGDFLQGEAFNEKNPSKKFQLLNAAFKTYEGIIIFGYHVENERLSLTQVNMGGMIINTGLEACYTFFKNTNDKNNEKLALEMINDNKKYLMKLDEKSRSMVSSFDPRSTEEFIVDWERIINVAENDDDTLFRLEAISLLGAALYNFLPLENIDPELPEKFRSTMTKELLKRIKYVLAHQIMFDRDPIIQDAARRSLAASEISILRKISFKKKLRRAGERKHSPWVPVYNF